MCIPWCVIASPSSLTSVIRPQKGAISKVQLKSTRITESPLKNLRIIIRHFSGIPVHIPGQISCLNRRFQTHILLINLSLLTGLPFFPALVLGVSVHISFTFSSTILQCLSNAFTRASSLRLFRHEIRTCACDRTAVCRMDRGPEVNSCSSSCAISNSLSTVSKIFAAASVAQYVSSFLDFARSSLKIH
jgi:hypothetical protein